MSKVTITFPNGKTKEYEKGITYYEISQELKKKKKY